MKKSLLALAVLGAFAGAASAQSSVTIYGKLDIAAGKNVGKADKTLLDNAGSRLGFKGVEDLGGGLAATFGFEHRFNPTNGNGYPQGAQGAADNPSTAFWNGYSKAGLQGAFGHIELGRDYTVAFLMLQNQIDPWGGDTVADLRDYGMRVGGITTARSASMVEYHFSANGFNFGADIAGSNENGRTSRPYSLAANYAAGPLFVGAALEVAGNTATSAATPKQWNLGARYNFGPATLALGYSKGTTAANADAKGYLVGLTAPIGSGDLKLGYARQTVGGTVMAAKYGVGYHYYLSKRTKLFGDVARDSKVAVVTGGSKTGYDLGIQHNF